MHFSEGSMMFWLVATLFPIGRAASYQEVREF